MKTLNRNLTKRRILVSLLLLIILYFEWQIYTWTPRWPPASPAYGLKRYYMSVMCKDGRRMGNLMFNYAALLGISRRNSFIPILPADFPLHDVFENLSIKRLDNVDSLLSMSRRFMEKAPCKYDHRTEDLTSKIKWAGYSLHGFYQSFRYFETVATRLREEFQFREEIQQRAKQFLAKIRGVPLPQPEAKSTGPSNTTVIIGIHVRRGDMTRPHSLEYGYKTPDSEFYRMAQEYFRTRFGQGRVRFIVCSDDKVWARKNIAGDDIVHSEATSPALEMAILAACDHTVVSIGTFGWWGAWLANGTTVYFSGWPQPKSKLHGLFSKHDYFPRHWIPMQ